MSFFGCGDRKSVPVYQEKLFSESEGGEDSSQYKVGGSRTHILGVTSLFTPCSVLTFRKRLKII